MADIIHQFTATIPAGTAKNSLFTSSFTMPPEDILEVEIEVPPGPSGLMGFYLAASGQQVIPFETGEFLVWDDRVAKWTVDNYPTQAKWSIVGYNLGNFPHDVTVRFHSASTVATATPSILPNITIVTQNADQPAAVAL
jgi:hypothetical protein